MWYYWCKLLWNWSVPNIYKVGVNHFRLVFGVSLFSRELRWHDQQNVCSTKSSNHWSVIIEYINFRLLIKCIYTIYDAANLPQLVSNFSLLQHREILLPSKCIYTMQSENYKSFCHVLDLYFCLCVEERPALAWWISRFFGNSKQFYKAMIRMRVQFWLNIMHLILQNHIFPSFLLYICIL